MNWRKVLSWKLIPELDRFEKQYVLRTGKLPQNKFQALGLDLSNWGRFKHPTAGVCYIAADVFRYIIEVQDGENVEDYSIDYEELVQNKINVFDFVEVIDEAIVRGSEDIREDTNLEELIEEEDVQVINLN